MGLGESVKLSREATGRLGQRPHSPGPGAGSPVSRGPGPRDMQLGSLQLRAGIAGSGRRGGVGVGQRVLGRMLFEAPAPLRVQALVVVARDRTRTGLRAQRGRERGQRLHGSRDLPARQQMLLPGELAEAGRPMQ